MSKEKIAISLDKNILDLIDSKVDGNSLRSRSQAIEWYLRKALKEESVNTAVILLKGDHQKIAMHQYKGKSLLLQQLDFLEKNGMNKICIITHKTKAGPDLKKEISKSKLNTEIIEKETKGNASALVAIKNIENDFVVMSGDVYNSFNLLRMIEKHKNEQKMATMGLMTRDKPTDYGTVVLDGDLIIDFIEKPKKAESMVVNAGIYIFKPEIFKLITSSTTSLERDIFPLLAKQHQLIGFFTHGEYEHLMEKARLQ